MHLKRNIENKLIAASKELASITLYGPRQVEKTTLLKKPISRNDHGYFG